MGGVLQRLAQRALPRSGGVRPRLAGRYEAAAAGPEFQPVPLAVPALSAPFEPPAPDRMQRPAGHEPHVAKSPASAPAPETSPVYVPHRPAEARPSVEAAVAPGRVRSAPSFPGEVQAERIVDPSEAQPLSARHTSLLAPANYAMEPDARPGSAAPESARIGLLLPELRAMASDLATAAEPVAHVLPGRREDGAQPPDVHISIGRIEVRADRPEPRKPQRAPTRPRARPMSLEDYLAKGRGR